MNTKIGGHLQVECLFVQGATHAFGVPYLARPAWV